MTNEEHILLLFSWKHPEFVNVQPSLGVNLWGDILYHNEIIAESNLHGLPLDKLGCQLPTSWNLVKSIADVWNRERT